ncbi:Protein O-mannosyltransferase 2 [Coemansia spiralis]|nr:Protein O-mannosyltransferase 2 [Coemansia spiralis]
MDGSGSTLRQRRRRRSSSTGIQQHRGEHATPAERQQRWPAWAGDSAAVVALTAAAAATRLWQIANGSVVTWDESHFGRFGALYLNRTVIHDVHPPLGKLTVALVQHLAGHNGTFGFPSAAAYPPWVAYAQMRAMLAVFGIALVPLAYTICVVLGMPRSVCSLAALFVLADNALCLMSRLIILDGMLLAATALVLLGTAAMARSRCSAGWMASTGAALGVAVSIKWAGLFSAALPGAIAMQSLLGDIAQGPWRRAARRMVLHTACLGAVPLAIYLLAFRVHFARQTERGAGEHHLPVRLQAQLRGNRFNRQPCSVALGASCKILPHVIDPASHAGLQAQRLPDTSAPRPVSCQAVLTGGDWWSFRHPPGAAAANYTHGPVEYLRDGAHVSLANDLSTQLLHADHSGIRTMSADGPQARNTSDMVWIVEIADYEMRGAERPMPSDNATDWDAQIVHPLATVFRLRHAATGCVLATDTAAVGDGGSMPVACVTNDRGLDALWRVPFSVDLRIGFDSNMRGKVRTSFVANTLALHGVMAQAHSGLVLDPDRYDVLESPPWSWPFLVRPMRMSGWAHPADAARHGAFYEIGNPLLWWASAVVCCLVYPLRFAMAVLCWRRHGHSHPRLNWQGCMLWCGWAAHYLPFFLMARVTYLHHYLPTLYFALLLLALECGRLADATGSQLARQAVLATCATAALAVFWHFRVCTYGWFGDRPSVAGLARLRWLPSWNIAGSPYDD